MPVGVGDALAIVSTLRQMVADFKQANEEVKNAKEKTLRLVRQVTITDAQLVPVEEHLRRSDPSKETVLSSILEDLGRALIQAHDRLEKFQRRAARVDDGSRVWESAKALFGGGVVKLNKRTSEITDDLRKLLVDLTQALQIETHAGVQKLLQAERGNCRDHHAPRQEYPIVLKMDDLCNVKLMIADSHSNEFRPPTVNASSSQQQGGRRGAREGGVEIGSCTKIQLDISIEDEERFLNVITFDNQLNEPPELFFPKTRGAQCKLLSGFTRRFPDETTYRTDPSSFKVVKDARLAADVVALQSVYVVLTTEQPKPLEDSTRILAMEDLERRLDDDDVFVKRFLFDMK